ncbi:MAG: ABC transporter substrate-binding protein [Proteobacteria bacterium]|nr:ABC transporter substrate-binding protein [Pseudomonadota bacterium]MBI3495878.1 ABC transporter substrate-binding protein [Pseudomonadota bacterium]
MTRRDFILLVGSAAAWPRMAGAQPAKMLRVGTANVQSRSAPQWVAFERRMAELGYQEGRNFTFDFMQISGTEAWEASYREAVARKADIIVAAGPELSLKSALAATDKLPIVMIAVDYDPVERGYVASLARPTGTVTGVYFQSTELAGKHLQLMKESFPDLATVAVFWDRPSADYWAALQAVAPRLGVRLAGVEFRERPYDYERAIAEVAPDNRQFLLAHASPFFFLDRVRLAEFALQHRMVSMLGTRESVLAGGLISYGPSLTGMFALAANYVDRIATGTKPTNMPIEQPTKFELVINLKTAKALGVNMPAMVLARADEVIE